MRTLLVPCQAGRLVGLPMLSCCFPTFSVTVLAPLLLSATSSQDSFRSPLCFSSAFVLSHVSTFGPRGFFFSPPQVYRPLPSGQGTDCLQGQVSSWCSASPWLFPSLPRALVSIPGCGVPFPPLPFPSLLILSHSFPSFPLVSSVLGVHGFST